MKWSHELAAACEIWKEIKFEFDTIDIIWHNLYFTISFQWFRLFTPPLGRMDKITKINVFLYFLIIQIVETITSIYVGLSIKMCNTHMQ
jgi:hypothetical protein